MPQYKLVYYNAMGIAETARMLFAIAGVEYEDYRFKDGEFATVKDKLPFGQVPVLEVDGKQLPQSTAINRYLAREFDLAGKDNWESAQCDMYVDGINDLLPQFRPWIFEQDAEKKKAAWKKIETEHLIPFLARYEKFLAANGSGYFVGNGLTWADVAIFTFVKGWLYAQNNDIIKDYPKINEFVDKIGNTPKIKEWIEKRPKTNM